jgi:hypothetical protein
MAGFNPAWFCAVGIAAVLTLLSATHISKGKKTILRVVAFACLLLGGIGLASDFNAGYELRWPFARRVESSGAQETSFSAGWPLPSKIEISDLADDLRAYQPDNTVIIYDDAIEEPLALAFVKAMHLANWKQPSMVGQPYSPRLGIEIFAGPQITAVLEPLKKFCRGQLKTEPTIVTTPQAGMGLRSVQITIGHNEAD